MENVLVLLDGRESFAKKFAHQTNTVISVKTRVNAQEGNVIPKQESVIVPPVILAPLAQMNVNMDCSDQIAVSPANASKTPHVIL